MNKLLDIEGVAKKFDLSKSTVNYYTTMGLFEIDHKKGNKRFYKQAHCYVRIKKIRDMLKIGYTLRLIKRELTNSK